MVTSSLEGQFMVNLTFGEQVKIILSRKGMTIKELAELVEKHTGKPMSRQNMTQRLGRDNFQEQDMRLIAKILGCKFQLSIMEMEELEANPVELKVEEVSTPVEETVDDGVDLTRDITIGELIGYEEETEEPLEVRQEIMPQVTSEVIPEEVVQEKKVDEREREILRKGISGYFKKNQGLQPMPKKEAPVVEKNEEIVGEINPYTGKEYKSNSVRMHPKRIGYVQVYDQEQHKWTEMTEWAFLGYQERKKVLLGKDYEPPIYLD